MRTFILTKDGCSEVKSKYVVAREVETQLEPGGMIVLSTKITKEVAAIDEQVINWVVSKIQRYLARVTNTELVLEDVFGRMNIQTGYGIGSPFHGKYYDKHAKKTYSEDSYAVDIRGVPFEAVKEAGKALRDAFNQTGVLVINHANNIPYLLENVD
jgi:hypothetical protein